MSCILIGIPRRFVVSERNLEEEVIEYKARESAEAAKIELANLNAFIEDLGLHRMRD